MEFQSLIISFLVLMFVVCGVVIFVLKRTFVSSTEGAVKRLDEEIAITSKKQAELSQKISTADAELKKCQAEAKDLAEKMRAEAEEESKAEREKMINKARQESEEIIAKAQNAKEKLKLELEKEFDTKIISVGMEILNDVLSQKLKGAFNDVLVDEFLEKLGEVDMSRIGPDVKSVDVISGGDFNDAKKKKTLEIIKNKLGREISLNVNVDNQIGGGVILKFGTMSLDGSIKNLIREAGVEKQTEIDAK